MIEADARTDPLALRAQLRPIVARRVHDPADVDDVVQEILERLLRGLERLEDESRFGPYVAAVTRHAIADHHRRAASARRRTADEAEPESDQDVGEPADGADGLAEVVRLFVEGLPATYREAIELSELGGVSQVEAARRLGLSVSGMKSRVQRGRALLREAIHACCEVGLDVRGHVVSCAPRADGPRPAGCCGDSAPGLTDRR